MDKSVAYLMLTDLELYNFGADTMMICLNIYVNHRPGTAGNTWAGFGGLGFEEKGETFIMIRETFSPTRIVTPRSRDLGTKLAVYNGKSLIRQ